MAKTDVLLKGYPDRNRPDLAKITMILYKPGFKGFIFVENEETEQKTSL